MLKEIGSNFWLPQGKKIHKTINDGIFNTTYDDIVYTSSGRNAISLVLSEIGEKNSSVLLPSFTCESVITPFLKKKYRVAYYDVDNGLEISKKTFTDSVIINSPSVVFIHNFFGFNSSSGIKDIIQELESEGIVIIEDITQSLYSRHSRLPADYYVGSFRKWDGIPDGGFALKSTGEFTTKPIEEDKQLVEAKLKAMDAKFGYMFNNSGDKESFLKMYLKAEEILEKETDLYRMSDVSYKEQANLDIKTLTNRRRENFVFLLQNLCDTEVKPLFDYLPNNVIPLFFPIICSDNRALVQGWLRTNHIYAPIVWPKPNCITEKIDGADFFYDNLLCIPCDQRYGIEEMEYIVNVLKAFNN